MICPHNKELMFDNKYGIKLYKHKNDDTPCDCLNSFLVTTDDIINEYSKQINEDIIFASCLKLRKKKYYEFSKCTDEKKAIKILKLFAEQYKNFPVYVEINYIFDTKKMLNTFSDYNLTVPIVLSIPTSNELEKYITNNFNKLPIPICLSKKINKIKDVIGSLKSKVNKINSKNIKINKKYFNF